MQIAKKMGQFRLIVSNINENIFCLVTKEIKKLKLKKVAFEAKNIPFLEYKTLNEELSKEKIDFLATKDLIKEMRMVKEKKEIALIKKSIEISKEGFEFIREIFDEEMSEKDLSIEIEKFLRLKGDNKCAFDAIVASGENTAYPHHLSGDFKLDKKIFLIDLGSKYYEYCADLTRMFFWDKMPLLFKKVYDTIRKAQSLSIKKIKEGITASEVDKTAREYIEKKGWGKYFGHGLGHGVGLLVHEPPYLVPNNDQVLKEGMVITIEPAIYIENRFGIRIEDMVLVKQNKGEVLSGDFDR